MALRKIIWNTEVKRHIAHKSKKTISIKNGKMSSIKKIFCFQWCWIPWYYEYLICALWLYWLPWLVINLAQKPKGALLLLPYDGGDVCKLANRKLKQKINGIWKLRFFFRKNDSFIFLKIVTTSSNIKQVSSVYWDATCRQFVVTCRLCWKQKKH